MILNTVHYENTNTDGIGVLQVKEPVHGSTSLFIPLKRTLLSGTINGPLASCQLTQVFLFSRDTFDQPLEAVYRFPLPGDAIITGAEVSFGDEVLTTRIAPRDDAKDQYHAAFEEGRKGVLLTRETADIFTLHLTGIPPGSEVRVRIDLLQYATPQDGDLVFRTPLTVAPRYIRDDEKVLAQENASPLLMLLDPGHTFSLDLMVAGNVEVTSDSHEVRASPEGAFTRVTFEDGEVRPDRDFILRTRPPAQETRPTLACALETYPEENAAYLLTTITPPAGPGTGRVPRELIILVDHSGSMQGPKWKAADWAVKKVLRSLQQDEMFALGVFHNTTAWLSEKVRAASEDAVSAAVRFLETRKDSGGTELGIALEQAIRLSGAPGDFARHIIILTDAEVTDEGRLVRLARTGQASPSPRRVSIICIDAAPNTPLVQEIVRVGKGIARYLTSDPSERDITTALDSVLASWQRPVITNLSICINSSTVEQIDGPPLPGKIPLPDLPGTPVTLVHRLPWSGETPGVCLEDRDGTTLAESRAAIVKGQGIRSLFGSGRVRALEQLRGGFYRENEIQAILSGLGYEKNDGHSSLYPGQDSFMGLFLDEILEKESIRFGIPSSLTAWVSTGDHRGGPVMATVVVPTAKPAGWDMVHGVPPVSCSAPPVPDMCMEPLESLQELRIESRSVIKRSGTKKRPLSGIKAALQKTMTRESIPPPKQPVSPTLEVTTVLAPEKGGILFSDPLPGWSRITGISLLESGDIVSYADLKIEIYLNSRASAIAVITVQDLLQGDLRPLNIAVRKTDRLVILLHDPLNKNMNGRITLRLSGEVQA
jgi:Ca-activated chloride channel family protein